MIAGISFRNVWGEACRYLALDRFSVVELVPFMDFESESLSQSQKQLDLWGSKTIWMHITTISTADTPSYFTSRVESLRNILSDVRVAGISLHFGIQHDQGRYLIQPFPAPMNQRVIDNSLRNLDTLRRLSGGKTIAVENISSGIDYSVVSGISYVDAWCHFLEKSGEMQLLDLTNLWNTARNSKCSYEDLYAQCIDAAPVAYYHLGGSFEFEGKWLDSHDRFQIDHQVGEVLRQLGENDIVVYEHDLDLRNLTFVKLQLDAFLENISDR